MRRGKPVEQACNREETTWYENHVVRFRQSVQSESRVEPGIRSRSEALVSSLTIRLARGCKYWHPLAPGRIYGARRSLLSGYISLHLSLKLTIICVPLSRIKWERYIFIKKCVSLIEFRKSCLIISLMNPYETIQQFVYTQRRCSKYCYLTLTIQLNSHSITRC